MLEEFYKLHDPNAKKAKILLVGAGSIGVEWATENVYFFANGADKVGYDYCITCSGCNFKPLKPMGESLGFTTVREESHKISD